MRPYTHADRAACLAILDGNTPPFFAPHERAEFEHFLDTLDDPYFVVEDDAGEVIGCGGYFVVRAQQWGGLSWGMVARSHHGKGAGRALLAYRLAWLRADRDVRVVRLQTSNRTQGFFAKLGFVVDAVKPDFYQPGLDLVEMHLASE